MISLEECVEFSDLEYDEIEAIAEHEHVPLIIAAEMGCQLARTKDGLRSIHTMLEEVADHAMQCGHRAQAEHYRDATRLFLQHHPELRPPSSL